MIDVYGRQIRVLADRSRDSGWSEALVNIEPDDVYLVTDNRAELNGSILSDYHVLAISGYSPLKYSEEELRLIRRFVEAPAGFNRIRAWIFRRWA